MLMGRAIERREFSPHFYGEVPIEAGEALRF